MKIWANTIVHNEENFIWFAVMSVVDYVDKVLIWDTGSTDKTLEIISEIKKAKGEKGPADLSSKIEFKQVGEVDRYQFTQMRQAMLEESKCDWILILDGDEIWWKDSIKKIIAEINKKGNKIDGVVVPMVVPVGDIYHIQEEKAGKYHLLGKTGHISLKTFSKNIPGLHVDLPYGKEGFFDKDGKLIQERKKIVFVEAPFLHVTHLKRSTKKRKAEKFKYELGKKVNKEFKFPEVFYSSFPKSAPSPWEKIKGKDLIISRLLTPLRSLKRKLQND